MLADAISSSLPMAVGVALSPIPVAAILVILMSARAATNAPAFLLGWMAGILTIGLIVSLMPGLLTARGEPTVIMGSIVNVMPASSWMPVPGGDELRELLADDDALDQSRQPEQRGDEQVVQREHLGHDGPGPDQGRHREHPGAQHAGRT